MPITEEINPNGMTIKPLKSSSDDVLKHIEKPLMNNTHFFYILNGKPSSGKSTMLMNLITQKKAYRKQFNKIFVISPSLLNIENNPLDELPENQKFNRLNIETLQEIEEEIRESGDKCLLVIDDCAAAMKKSDIQETLLEFIFNRRNICSDGNSGSLSLIITTQVYNKIPLDIRKCADILFFWRTLNKKELSFVKDEYLSSIPSDKIDDILKYTYQKPNDCLIIRLNDHLDYMLYKNFNRLLWRQG